jgi:hypothetical protein
MISNRPPRQPFWRLFIGSIGLSMAVGCHVFSALPRTATKKASTTLSRLFSDIQNSGGHFDSEAGVDPLKVQTVFLPEIAIKQIRLTSLAAFPKLKAVMIIETRDNQEHQLTGFLVDGPADLLAAEYGYQDAGFFK